MNPTIAVAIPVYNGAEYLSLAIDSALAQRRPPDQIVVVDDASTDQTPEILRRYKGPLISIHRLPDRLPAPQAWNEAVRLTSADFVGVLAHDDLWHVNFLEEAERAILAFQDLDFFITGHELIDSQGKRQGVCFIPSEFRAPGLVSSDKFLDKFTQQGQFFLPTATIFRRALYDQVGGFDPRIRVAYDWEFFLRSAALAKIYLDDRALVSYRIHETQSIAGHVRADNGDSDVIFEKLPEIGRHLNERQKDWLVENMCDFLRRFATWPVANATLPAAQVVESRRRIVKKLEAWRHAANPYAKYVRIGPRHWRQWFMWNCGRNAVGVRLARLLLRARGGPTAEG